MAFQGSLKDLPLQDVVQLIAVSGKTGKFTIQDENDVAGDIYILNGRIVHAQAGELLGEAAIYQIATWREGDFAFHPGDTTDDSSVKKSNTKVLMEVARVAEKWEQLSQRIPSSRMVPVFTNTPARHAISLEPMEWSVARCIDEQRSIEELAEALDLPIVEVAAILFDMIGSDLVVLTENLRHIDKECIQQMTAQEQADLVEQIVEVGLELGGSTQLKEIATAERKRCHENLPNDGMKAIFMLLREMNRQLATQYGRELGRSFIDRVGQLVKTKR